MFGTNMIVKGKQKKGSSLESTIIQLDDDDRIEGSEIHDVTVIDGQFFECMFINCKIINQKHLTEGRVIGVIFRNCVIRSDSFTHCQFTDSDNNR